MTDENIHAGWGSPAKDRGTGTPAMDHSKQYGGQHSSQADSSSWRAETRDRTAPVRATKYGAATSPGIGSLQWCGYCGAVLGLRWLGRSGYRYGDGRTICEVCHASAIKTAGQLAAAWRYVARSFIQLQLSVNWANLPVGMLDQPDLERGTGSAHAIGVAVSEVSNTSVRSRIGILYGMPTAMAVETLAHEAGHVWCREHRVQFRPEDAEEGYCNVLSCLALESLPIAYEPKRRIESLFANPDPIYGQNFREQWTVLTRLGWDVYRRQVMALR